MRQCKTFFGEEYDFKSPLSTVGQNIWTDDTVDSVCSEDKIEVKVVMRFMTEHYYFFFHLGVEGKQRCHSTRYSISAARVSETSNLIWRFRQPYYSVHPHVSQLGYDPT